MLHLDKLKLRIYLLQFVKSHVCEWVIFLEHRISELNTLIKCTYVSGQAKNTPKTETRKKVRVSIRKWVKCIL